MKTPSFVEKVTPPTLFVAYVTQRPSAEKLALVGADDRTSPNREIFLSTSDRLNKT